MAKAINIPGVGEGLGRFIRVFTFGTSTASPDVVITSGTGVTTLVSIDEPNVFVESIDLQVIEALATAGSGISLIGDEVDSDGFWTDTLGNFAATAAVFNNMATSVGYGGGKLYTVTDTIDFVRGIATAKKGLVKARITYSRGNDTTLNSATST
jgi:hypothetical protein